MRFFLFKVYDVAFPQAELDEELQLIFNEEEPETVTLGGHGAEPDEELPPPELPPPELLLHFPVE